MYKSIIVDNYLDSAKAEIYEKECATLEEAEEAYVVIFSQAKTLILEILEFLSEADKEQSQVIKQIIDVVSDLEINEEIELTSGEERFLQIEKNLIEFSLAGKHIVGKVVEV